ncbi:putative transposase domain protein [Glaesserella parasuis SW114]|nr:putative transposase domain protein [Glaesserella parasuis SW114]
MNLDGSWNINLPTIIVGLNMWIEGIQVLKNAVNVVKLNRI